MYARITWNGKTWGVPVTEDAGDGCRVYRVSREVLPETPCRMDLCPELLTSGCDEKGFMTVPRGTSEGGTMLTRFREREDTEYVSDGSQMPVIGFARRGDARLLRVTGLTWDSVLVCGVKDGVYYAYPRFLCDRKTADEDPAVTVYELPAGSTYSDMARFYRDLRRKEGCRTLRERAAASPELRYAVRAPEVRIRCAWKPCPSPVEDQTPETEPPVHAACTFRRVGELMEAMHGAGIPEAEMCLVGFECRGHDGRWPQLFPVEETLGGEGELRSLIREGQDLGYQMTAHTNSTCSYRISEDWDEGNLLRDENGNPVCDPILWSGGRSHLLCPTAALRFARRDLPRVRDLGFRGLHYVDVLTNFAPRKCSDPRHPLTRRQTIGVIRELMGLCHELYGGFASEGAFDWAEDLTDYVLYTSYNLMGKQPPICDETIPFWQIVYHGTTLYNPSTETVNFCVKPEAHHLKYLEYGGRPLFYFYSKYVGEGSCGNWMGEEDLRCDGEEDLLDAVRRMAETDREYREIADLQYEEMERHEKIAPGVYETEYSDGRRMTVDYGAETWRLGR